MSRRTIIIPVVVAMSLGFAACGGDDDDEALSKSEISKKANEICKTSSAASDKIDEPDNLRQDPVAAAAYFNKLLPVVKKQTDEFEDLEPDDDVKAAWTQLVDRQKQGLETITVVRDKAEAKDTSGVQDLDKAVRIGPKFATEADAVGATGCDSPGG